ncbi:MAG: MBL fold metallo-hydrolase [Bacteroidales bacterium]|nr:MBL fold metallo-hydrolase [Bacteroidales bacterium]
MLKLKTFVFNAFGENTYVVYDETKQCIIIDPGCSSSVESEQLFSFIDSKGLKPLMVINTHGHIDHIMGNAAVKKHYGIKVAAHADVRSDFLHAKRQAAIFGLPFADDCELPDVELIEDEVIKVGESTLEVIATPGHAKGSISLYAELEGWVFTGDALFCRSIGRTDFEGGSFEELRGSIRGKLFHLPDDTTVLPGHGEETTIGDEQRYNMFLG